MHSHTTHTHTHTHTHTQNVSLHMHRLRALSSTRLGMFNTIKLFVNWLILSIIHK